MSAFVLCHHCQKRLPLQGRWTQSLYPCCGEDACHKARKRAYEAARRVRLREAKKATTTKETV